MHDAKGLLVALKACGTESRCVRVSSVFSARSEHTSVRPDSCLTHSTGVSVIDSSGAASRPLFHGGSFHLEEGGTAPSVRLSRRGWQHFVSLCRPLVAQTGSVAAEVSSGQSCFSPFRDAVTAHAHTGEDG